MLVTEAGGRSRAIVHRNGWEKLSGHTGRQEDYRTDNQERSSITTGGENYQAVQQQVGQDRQPYETGGQDRPPAAQKVLPNAI